MDKKTMKMFMFVYNDLNQDARVQRSLDALKGAFDICIISTGKVCNIDGVRNIAVNSRYASGIKKYLDICRQVISIGKKEKFDYLYLQDYYSCLPGLFLLKRNVKAIYDAHELMVDTADNVLGKREKIFHYFEKKLIKKTDLVIAAQRNRAEIMQQYFGLTEVPYVVPNFSELPLDAEITLTEEMRMFFQEDNRKVFVYAGALIQDRRIDVLIKETAKLSDKYKLLIIGDGCARNSLEQFTHEYPELKCCFTGNIPYKCLGSLLQKCHVGYVSYATTSLNNTYCASNKIYEYASVNLPMVCNDNPTLYSTVTLNGIGVTIAQCDQKGTFSTVSGGLSEILDHYDSYIESIKNFRNVYSWASIREDYCQKVLSLK